MPKTTKKMNMRTKILIGAVSAVLSIVVIVFAIWLWMVASIPTSVDKTYKEYSSDTHLQGSILYCLSGPQRVYMVKALYAPENVASNSSGTGSIGYAFLFNEKGVGIDSDSDGYPKLIDLDANGKLVNNENTYGNCIFLRGETEKATP